MTFYLYILLFNIFIFLVSTFDPLSTADILNDHADLCSPYILELFCIYVIFYLNSFPYKSARDKINDFSP